jgi:hypothetical protein
MPRIGEGTGVWDEKGPWGDAGTASPAWQLR